MSDLTHQALIKITTIGIVALTLLRLLTRSPKKSQRLALLRSLSYVCSPAVKKNHNDWHCCAHSLTTAHPQSKKI